MSNLFAVCVSEGEHKTLEDGIQLAEKHFDNGDEASAWYVLLTVAERKGMIQGYTEKRYDNERPEVLRQQLVEGGKKGGEGKGKSFTALANETMDTLATEGGERGGWRLKLDLDNHLEEVAQRIYAAQGIDGAQGIELTDNQLKQLKKHPRFLDLSRAIKTRR